MPGSTTDVLNESIYTPGKLQQAVINVGGELKKTFNLTPFNVDPPGSLQNPNYKALHADDIIYGGLGNDFLHGGSGNDLISGAEALSEAWFEKFASYTSPSASNASTITRSDYTQPYNPGNALGFEARKAEEFAAYDEYNPLTKILLNGGEYFANFVLEGPMSTFGDGKLTDGNDRMFGDLGHDWLVGGTGRITSTAATATTCSTPTISSAACRSLAVRLVPTTRRIPQSATRTSLTVAPDATSSSATPVASVLSTGRASSTATSCRSHRSARLPSAGRSPLS